MRKHAKTMTAAEFIAKRQNDPEWVAADKEREEKSRARGERLRAEEAPMLADLRAAGWEVESIWDFVNTRDSYPTAVPVLAAHLDRSYDPWTREGIIRALTVPEARGETAQLIIDQLKRSDNEDKNIRWALANALTVIADKTMVGDLIDMHDDKRFEDVKKILKVAAIKAEKR